MINYRIFFMFKKFWVYLKCGIQNFYVITNLNIDLWTDHEFKHEFMFFMLFTANAPMKKTNDQERFLKFLRLNFFSQVHSLVTFLLREKFETHICACRKLLIMMIMCITSGVVSYLIIFIFFKKVIISFLRSPLTRDPYFTKMNN